MKPVELLHVAYAPEPGREVAVGRLARKGREILFEYDAAFLRRGLPLSPLKLPLRPGVVVGDPATFHGLMGVFEDSLPDGWGRLLLDRRIARSGGRPAELGPLDRLAWVGAHAMGALVYQPEHGVDAPTVVDLVAVEKDSQAVLADADDPDLDRLLALGGSPQGARPKALVQLAPGEERVLFGGGPILPGHAAYLVKFRAPDDDTHAGVLEHAYARMAAAAGIDMPPTRLLGRTARRPGYFAARRFDRVEERRIHVHTLSGLLHAPHTYPSLTYRDLLRVTRGLTRNEAAVAEVFRRACFNVLAHNRDDHAKNFAFVMDEKGGWSASPAYDLTFSSGPGGEHAMLIGGEGRRPTRAHLEALAAELDVVRAARILDEVRAAVARFRTFADEAGLPKRRRDAVARALAI